jgi:hypothetical protein
VSVCLELLNQVTAQLLDIKELARAARVNLPVDLEVFKV